MIYNGKPKQTQVQLENDSLRVIILPQMGGRIISLFHKGKSFEAAAQPGSRDYESGELSAESRESGTENGGTVGAEDRACAGQEGAKQLEPYQFAPYAYGMDDAFPNIDEEDFTWRGRNMHYPDHGEIWRGDFQVIGCSEKDAALVWESPDFNYRYEKNMSLKGDSLKIQYCITNIGHGELPAFWTWHGLMHYEEDMRIILPEGAELFRNVLDEPILGKSGTVYTLQNSRYDFTRVPDAKSRCALKYYAESRIREGRCGFYYPSAGVRCILEYDAEKLPYLGVWITAGGFQGDYNCALEPTNGFYDSVSRAAGNGKLPVLAPGERMEFELVLTLTAEDEITEIQ